MSRRPKKIMGPHGEMWHVGVDSEGNEFRIAEIAGVIARSPVDGGSIMDTSLLFSPGEDVLRANLLMESDRTIEKMEARGAQEVVAQRRRLPTDGLDKKQAEAVGIEVHDVDTNDPIWTHVTLPEGWKIERTDHSMHTKLVDEKGRKRGGIFYKAAYYDRSANMHFTRRFTVNAYGDDCVDPPYESGKPWPKKQRQRVLVKDTATDEVLFATDWLEPEEPRNFDAEEALVKEACEWLDETFPLHNHPAAYWD